MIWLMPAVLCSATFGLVIAIGIRCVIETVREVNHHDA